MLLTPRYHVTYNGVLHPPGIPFRIDRKDMARMQRHGDLQDEPESLSENVPAQIEEDAKPVATAKRGRPRKSAM